MNDQKQDSGGGKWKKIILVLTILLVLSVGGLIGRSVYLAFFDSDRGDATVSNNIIGGGDEKKSEDDKKGGDETGAEAESASEAERAGGKRRKTGATDGSDSRENHLYQDRPKEGQAFTAKNLFPGDREKHDYRVKVHHNEDTELFFRISVTEQTKNLGEVLRVKVVHPDTGNVLVDAPFSEISGEEISEKITKNTKNETTLDYFVEVSLDTSVGNEYQEAMLKADFEWYVKDTGGLIPSPKTGDSLQMLFWCVLMVSASLLLLILWKQRKEEKRHGAQ